MMPCSPCSLGRAALAYLSHTCSGAGQRLSFLRRMHTKSLWCSLRVTPKISHGLSLISLSTYICSPLSTLSQPSPSSTYSWTQGKVEGAISLHIGAWRRSARRGLLQSYRLCKVTPFHIASWGRNIFRRQLFRSYISRRSPRSDSLPSMSIHHPSILSEDFVSQLSKRWLE